MERKLGTRQRIVLERARRSRRGYVKPADFLERRACKRLTGRGLLVPALGFPDLWQLTDKGWAAQTTRGTR